MPEFYRLGMTKEEINDTLQTAVREPQPVVAGNFAAFTEDGQIIDSEKSAEDFAPAPLTRNLTLYVNADTGSDSNDGLIAERPKKTIRAAIDAIPKNLGAGQAIVNIAAGKYDENVIISGFFGGASAYAPVQIVGAGIGTTEINGFFYIQNTTISSIRALTINGYFRVYNAKAVLKDILISYNTQYWSIDSLYSELWLYHVQINNSTGSGIRSVGAIYVYSIVGTVSGVGVTIGSVADGLPGLCVIRTNSIDAGTKYQKAVGSAIIENGVLI